MFIEHRQQVARRFHLTESSQPRGRHISVPTLQIRKQAQRVVEAPSTQLGSQRQPQQLLTHTPPPPAPGANGRLRPGRYPEGSEPGSSVPDLNVALPGAGGEDRGQHRVEGGTDAGLCVPRQRACPAGSAEAVEQDAAIGTARHQQVAVRGALAAHRIAFHLQRPTHRVSRSCHSCSSRPPVRRGPCAHSTEGRPEAQGRGPDTPRAKAGLRAEGWS